MTAFPAPLAGGPVTAFPAPRAGGGPVAARGLRLLRVAMLLLVLALGACERDAPASLPVAPVSSQAAWLLEPPVLAVGDVAEARLAVVTPPGWSLRPVPRPAAPSGLAWIERAALPVEREPARWLHRTRLRLRALEIGRFELPAGEVAIVSPEGVAEVLAYAALPIEVVSTLGDAPTRPSPFGVRRLPRRTAGRGALAAAFAAGAGVALAGVGLLVLARRRLAAPAEASPAAGAGEDAARWAREELARAGELLARDPRAALDRVARALRLTVVKRFGGETHVRTTEELAGMTPPFVMTTRWRRFVALLADLDAARFPPAEPADAAELLERARAFVEEIAPAETA